MEIHKIKKILRNGLTNNFGSNCILKYKLIKLLKEYFII